MNSLRAVIAAWLKAFQRSRVGVGMNRSAIGRSVKRFEHSQGLDTALCNSVPFSCGYMIVLQRIGLQVIVTLRFSLGATLDIFLLE